MRLAVITSGGDSSGMNPCLAQIVKGAEKRGHQVIGYRRGYLGIRDNDFVELFPKDVQGWYKLGGTILKTGRMPELKEVFWQRKLVENLKANAIDALIVIGGDGSFRGARDLHGIDNHLNIIGIPGTIDNNIFGSDYSLGYDTALNKQVQYLDDITDTAMSLPGRVFFVETLGAWDSYLTTSSVKMGMADFAVLIDPTMTDLEICDRVKGLLERGDHDFVIATFAEGSAENSIHRMVRSAEFVRDRLQVKVKSNVIGYQQRGGVPSALDRLHASGFAEYALDAIDKGVTNSYVVYKNGKYEYLDITEAENKKKDN